MSPTPVDDVRAAIPTTLWYHTMELAPGVVTPGWFDLRPILEKMPWPDVAGKRCLDVGTYDGHLAFELERRGAAEVTAVDIDSHEKWDWPPRLRATGPDNLAAIAGPKGRGFEIARDALGSKVKRLPLSVYELAGAGLGHFDVVVCGSLMLHLRNPVDALEAIRAVCGGVFLSAEEVDVPLTTLHRSRPYARFDGTSTLCEWWIPNIAAYHRMLIAAGFDIDRSTGLYAVPFGVSHPGPKSLRGQIGKVARQALTRSPYGVPHAAVLARPAI